MKKFMAWMEKHFVPVAAKIGSLKYLVAVRDAFLGMLPVTMAGSFATLLNVIFRDIPGNLKWESFAKFFSPVVAVNGVVWWASLAIFSLIFAISLGYQICKAADVDPMSGALVGVASFIAVVPQSHAGAWGGLSWGYLNTGAIFTALIIVAISSAIFIALSKSKLTIKMPESVPPAVAKAFKAMIPGIIAIYAVSTLSHVVGLLSGGQAINDLVFKFIQAPFMGASQNFFAVIIVALAVQVLWFFGLHGTSVLGPVIEGIYKTATLDNATQMMLPNANAFQLEFIWTKASFDTFVWMGGAGCTLALLLAIFIVSKKVGDKAIAKVGIGMGVFNINEPVMFGLPVVLNPIYFIPFIIIPPILTAIAYGATAFGIIPRTFVDVPWITPPVLGAILATGGNILAGVVALINFAVATLIWMVFVKLGNKTPEAK